MFDWNDRDLLFANLNWKDLADLVKDERFLVLLPVGATEEHGPHCPLATDCIIASAVSLAMARRLREMGYPTYVLPPVAYTAALAARNFPGTINISEQTQKALLTDLYTSLIRHGIRNICVVNNHGEPANVRAIFDSIDAAQRSTGVRVIFPNKLRRRNAERLGEAFKSGDTHADRYETSLLMAVVPHLVDEERRRALPPLPVGLPQKLLKDRIDDFKLMGMAEGYCGDPAAASAEEGWSTLDTLIQINIEAIEAAFRGEAGNEGRGLFGSSVS